MTRRTEREGRVAVRWGVPPNDEADEQLEAALILITEMEREVLRNASHYIYADGEKYPAVRRLAGEVLSIANKLPHSDPASKRRSSPESNPG